jgi:hypothetical protein
MNPPLAWHRPMVVVWMLSLTGCFRQSVKRPDGLELLASRATDDDA